MPGRPTCGAAPQLLRAIARCLLFSVIVGSLVFQGSAGRLSVSDKRFRQHTSEEQFKAGSRPRVQGPPQGGAGLTWRPVLCSWDRCFPAL
jgi:hypothetical protein